jgi:uncharacterized protein YndB with AHSA1/START domain
MLTAIEFNKDKVNSSILVKAQFKAPVEKVWSYFTTAECLERWWAPLPYRAVTRTMNFTNGGRWLYYMLSPKGEKHWCFADYSDINDGVSFKVADAFCDENAVINTEVPGMRWEFKFEEKDNMTLMSSQISFQSADDMDKILDMGFEKGFGIALKQLQELLSDQ